MGNYGHLAYCKIINWYFVSAQQCFKFYSSLSLSFCWCLSVHTHMHIHIPTQTLFIVLFRSAVSTDTNSIYFHYCKLLSTLTHTHISIADITSPYAAINDRMHICCICIYCGCGCALVNCFAHLYIMRHLFKVCNHNFY